MNTTNISDTLINEIISKVKYTIDKETDRGCVLVSAIYRFKLEKYLRKKTHQKMKERKKKASW